MKRPETAANEPTAVSGETLSASAIGNRAFVVAAWEYNSAELKKKITASNLGLVFLGWDSPPGGSSGFLPVSKDLLWLLGKLAVVVADPVDRGDHVGLGQASMVIQGQAEAPVERLDRVRGPLPGRVEFKEGKQVALAMQGRQTVVDAPVSVMGVPPGPSLSALVGRNVFGVGTFFQIVPVLGVDLDQQFHPCVCFFLGGDLQQTP